MRRLGHHCHWPHLASVIQSHVICGLPAALPSPPELPSGQETLLCTAPGCSAASPARTRAAHLSNLGKTKRKMCSQKGQRQNQMEIFAKETITQAPNRKGRKPKKIALPGLGSGTSEQQWHILKESVLTT